MTSVDINLCALCICFKLGGINIHDLICPPHSSFVLIYINRCWAIVVWRVLTSVQMITNGSLWFPDKQQLSWGSITFFCFCYFIMQCFSSYYLLIFSLVMLLMLLSPLQFLFDICIQIIVLQALTETTCQGE